MGKRHSIFDSGFWIWNWRLPAAAQTRGQNLKFEPMLNALRWFVESHPTELMERFIREDVEWGLHGDE